MPLGAVGQAGLLIGGIGSVVGAGANIASSIASLKLQKQSLKDAKDQLNIENKRYDDLMKKQDAFAGEVNASASSYDSPTKKKSIADEEMPMDRI